MTRHWLTKHQEDCVVFWCVIVVGVLCLFFAAPVKPETATTQSKEPANTSAKAKSICPKGMRVRATMSRSIWNKGGWPLWETVCIGDKK